MSGRVLSIDIQGDLLSAVILQSDDKKHPVIERAAVELVDSRPIEEVFTQLIEKTGYDGEPCHVSFGADAFYYRNLTLPFADRKTVNRVLPFELEETVSGESDQLVIDSLTSKGSDGEGEILAAILPKDFLASWLAVMQSVEIDPETVTISGLATVASLLGSPEMPSDFLFLSIGLRRVSLIRVQSGTPRLIRSLVFDPGRKVGYQLDAEKNSAVALRPESVDHAIEAFCHELTQTLQAIGCPSQTPVYLTGVQADISTMAARITSHIGLSCVIVERENLFPVFEPGPDVASHWSSEVFANAVDLAWQVGKGWHSLDFRKGEFGRKYSFSQKDSMLKGAAALLLLAMVGYFVYLVQDYNRVVGEKNKLTEEIRAVFVETLPDVGRIVDPLQQMQVRVNELKSSGVEKGGGTPAYTVLEILAEISRLIPNALDVELKRMVIDGKGVRVMGITDNFNTVDGIKKFLGQSALFSEVTISSANVDPKSSKIKFELKLIMEAV